MKKINAIMVLMVFLLSLVPTAAFADEHVADNSGSGSQEDADTDTSTDKPAEETDIQRRMAKAEAENNKIAARKIADIRDLATRFKAIRDHQEDRLMNAVEICREKAENPERCARLYTARLELVKKLSEKDLERLSRVQAKKEEHKEDVDALRTKENFRKFDKELQKARVITTEKFERARSKFNEATDEYKEALGNYEKARGKATKLKDVLKECEDSDTEECKLKLSEHKVQTKEFLLHAADVILAQLEKMKSRIESSEDLSEEEASKMLERINSRMEEIREARAAVEDLNADSSREQIKQAAEKIRKAWANIKHDVKKDVEEVVNSRVAGIIVRSKHLETKLHRMLEKMAEEGTDTSQVESLVADFNAAIDEASKYYDQSLESLKAFKGEKDADLVREAHDLRKKAHESLVKANSILKDIHKALKAQGKSIEESDDEEEVEDELEDEDDSEDEGE
ncbi:MAG: hypothetical protein Q8R00_02320 [Candidatus Nanoarchaeia archaeon]|nr:hypothetical protein [Candidatus Nanoarchaeia archaeon]